MRHAPSEDDPAAPAPWSPWRVGFGAISPGRRHVYEGARSVYGPLLVSLGGSALVVGAVTGAGAAAALVAALPLLAFGDSLGRVVAGTQVVAALLLLSVVLRAARGARPQPPVPINR